LKDILTRGWLGEPVLATIDMRAIPHWMPWSEGLKSLSTFIMSIHHLDTFRYWLGTPERVLASTRPDPRTKFPHTDGINLYILEYANEARASSWDDVWTGPVREGSQGDIGIRWRFEGTEGAAFIKLGVLLNYPEGEPAAQPQCLGQDPQAGHLLVPAEPPRQVEMDQRGSGQAGGDSDLPVRRGQGALQAELAQDLWHAQDEQRFRLVGPQAAQREPVPLH